MFKFIMAVTCPECGEVVKDSGITVDFTTDEPVVNLELFSQQEFYCENCNTSIYTGDTEMFMDWETNEIEESDGVFE